ALAHYLKQINPQINLSLINKMLCPADVSNYFSQAEILIEAFDKATDKQWLIETWCELYPKKYIICGSGISGLGDSNKLRVQNAGRIIFCGDQFSEMSEGLCSARVAIVANMQANEAIELLVKNRTNEVL
ncbi:MAG: ThiF family adenylyltransferase, partial [Candidatus Cloacimonetes bacterium]|nr:ThiF family adenylyltransferase [Candidatus Cloacimonadota bacterium]